MGDSKFGVSFTPGVPSGLNTADFAYLSKGTRTAKPYQTTGRSQTPEPRPLSACGRQLDGCCAPLRASFDRAVAECRAARPVVGFSPTNAAPDDSSPLQFSTEGMSANEAVRARAEYAKAAAARAAKEQRDAYMRCALPPSLIERAAPFCAGSLICPPRLRAAPAWPVSNNHTRAPFYVCDMSRSPSPATRRFGDTDDMRGGLPSVDALRRQRERQAEEARRHERTVSPLRDSPADLASLPSLAAPTLLSKTESLVSVKWGPSKTGSGVPASLYELQIATFGQPWTTVSAVLTGARQGAWPRFLLVAAARPRSSA